VKDIAGAFSLAFETPGVTGVFNTGYGGQITFNGLAGRIIGSAGPSSKVLHGPERAGGVKHSGASADKFRATGWIPSHTLEEGLGTTMEFFQKTRAWRLE